MRTNIDAIINYFVDLAQSTYDIEETQDSRICTLEKKHDVYEIIAYTFSSILNQPCIVWAFYKEKNRFTYKYGYPENHLSENDYLQEFDLEFIDKREDKWDHSILDKENQELPSLLTECANIYDANQILLLPLVSPKQADLVGIATCFLEKDFSINDTEVFILRGIAVQSALAVDHARLIERLASVEKVAAQINESINSILVLKEILLTALDLLKFSTGYLYLADAAKTKLYLVEYQSDGPITPFEGIPIGDGIHGSVAQREEPIYINNIKEADIELIDIQHDFGSILAVPIVAAKELIGVLSIVSSRVDAFTKLDVFTIHSFSQLVSSAILGFLRTMEVGYTELVLASEDHSLSTTIITVSGASEILLDKLQTNKIDSNAIELAEIISRNCQKGLRRWETFFNNIDQERTLGSRIYQTSWRIEPIFFDSLVEVVIKDKREDYASDNIEIIFEKDVQYTNVNGIKNLLQLALQELLINAKEELLEIDTCREIKLHMVNDSENNIEFIIQDSGRGVKEEYKQIIFNQRFSSKLPYRGRGFTIIKFILESHGGTIELLPCKENTGATFLIRLPTRSGGIL